jgi:hypothetical protein
MLSDTLLSGGGFQLNAVHGLQTAPAGFDVIGYSPEWWGIPAQRQSWPADSASRF